MTYEPRWEMSQPRLVLQSHSVYTDLELFTSFIVSEVEQCSPSVPTLWHFYRRWVATERACKKGGPVRADSRLQVSAPAGFLWARVNTAVPQGYGGTSISQSQPTTTSGARYGWEAGLKRLVAHLPVPWWPDPPPPPLHRTNVDEN